MKTKRAKSKTENTKRVPGFVLPAGIAVTAVFVALLAVLIIHARSTIVIAFYDVPPAQRNAITALTISRDFGGESDYKTLTLDETKTLKEQIGKKPRMDILFTRDGINANSVASMMSQPDDATLRTMPSNMRQIAGDNEKAYCLPVLIDDFELSCNRKLLSDSGQSIPVSIASMAKAANAFKDRVPTPILCAGGNDDDLLSLVGALIEATDGEEKWNEYTKLVAQGENLKTLLISSRLGSTLAELVRWRQDGLLHKEWFRMKDKDIAAFMERDITVFAFLSLSAHRSFPIETMRKYETLAVPSETALAERSLTMPILVGAIPSNRRKPAAKRFLENLVSEQGQKELGIRTGLAPVNSNADTIDKQATDARFWAAACLAPVPDPARAALASPADRATLAQDIRQYLEADGVGY